MTNYEYVQSRPKIFLAHLVCGMFRCGDCPFEDKKPKDIDENCVLWWFNQEHEPLMRKEEKNERREQD